MAKIPADKLISIFRKMYEEHWPYTWGAAQYGNVDCSGAFVYAYKQFGQSIAHGSNAIARRYVVKLLPVSEARPGMAAFKRRKPGDAGYALPDSYKGGSDLNDYYHIGLVDSDGQHVLNAQGEKAGFTRTPVSKWAYVAELKAVDYGEPAGEDQDRHDPDPDPLMGDATVTAPNGGTVNVRAKPSGAKQDALPTGAAVTILETRDGWCLIDYHKQGWMMARFLENRDEGVG